MSVLQRNNVTVAGAGARPMVFAHGYGCDQAMWRLVAPAFADDYRLVLFDHVGAGRSDLAAYDRRKYSTLQGYADDLLELCAALGIEHGVFVGHSVSAMIGVLAAIKEPDRFDRLVLIGPSPRYIDDDGYAGGFSEADIRGLLAACRRERLSGLSSVRSPLLGQQSGHLAAFQHTKCGLCEPSVGRNVVNRVLSDRLLEFQDSNYLGWASSLGPAIMGNADRPELAEELTNSFCRTDPAIARQFAAVTFLSDNRADLPNVPVPSLILQCREDVLAPLAVGEYVQRRLPGSRLVVLDATGHCPHLSAPEETIAAIRDFLRD